jgi:hypothetical protein
MFTHGEQAIDERPDELNRVYMFFFRTTPKSVILRACDFFGFVGLCTANHLFLIPHEACLANALAL